MLLLLLLLFLCYARFLYLWNLNCRLYGAYFIHIDEVLGSVEPLYLLDDREIRRPHMIYKCMHMGSYMC